MFSGVCRMCGNSYFAEHFEAGGCFARVVGRATRGVRTFKICDVSLLTERRFQNMVRFKGACK